MKKPTHEVEGWCDDPACDQCCYHLEQDHGECVQCGQRMEGIDVDQYEYEGDEQ